MLQVAAVICWFVPIDDVPFVPDDRTRTQLDLLGKGPMVHAGIDQDHPHPFISRTKGRRLPVGPPLLKEHRCLRKDAAVQLWKSLQTKGRERTTPLWGANAEP